MLVSGVLMIAIYCYKHDIKCIVLRVNNKLLNCEIWKLQNSGNKYVNCQHTAEYNKTLHRKYQKFCFDTVHLLV